MRSYLNTINRIKTYPISKRKLKSITVEHLQAFFDLLATGSTNDKGKQSKGLMHGTRHIYGAVLRGAFTFAVFPKKLISFNPMQYVVNRNANDNYELFTETRTEQASITKTISEKQYLQLIEILAAKNNPAILPIQIAYYTGLRLGEACSLTWQDIDFDEQYITVRRSICYNNTIRKTVLGPTKRKKVRTVYFGSTLLQILKGAKEQQLKNEQQYGGLYLKNYYKVVQELLGRSDINTTLNIYAHASNESKKKSAMLLD